METVVSAAWQYIKKEVAPIPLGCSHDVRKPMLQGATSTPPGATRWFCPPLPPCLKAFQKLRHAATTHFARIWLSPSFFKPPSRWAARRTWQARSSLCLESRGRQWEDTDTIARQAPTVGNAPMSGVGAPLWLKGSRRRVKAAEMCACGGLILQGVYLGIVMTRSNESTPVLFNLLPLSREGLW